MDAARESGDEEAAANRVAADWERRLLRIVEDDPEAAEELRRLLAEVLPGASYDIAFDVPPPAPAASGVQPDQLPALTGTFSNRVA
ncbi:hypothetical protein [Streptomyces puniciscabiei]|uniref:hypothetical protein n=1 Tax=Streptomyces puniciscabiei TaxID=164348 RepID=UPI0037A805F2